MAHEPQWAAIESIPDIDVSDTGIVRAYWKRINTHDGAVKVRIGEPRVLPQYLNPSGYFYVRFTDTSGRYRPHLVHRLVLMAFVGPCPEGREGCHRDGSRTGNHLDNLYWGTRKQNCLDTSRHERRPKAKLSREQVDELVRLYDSGWLQKNLAEKFGINSASVSNMLNSRGRANHGHRAYAQSIPAERIIGLRREGLEWSEIARQLNISEHYARRKAKA